MPSIFFPETQFFSVALEPVQELALVDQAGLKLTEIRLPLCLSAGIKGVSHHCPAFYVSLGTLKQNKCMFVFSSLYQYKIFLAFYAFHSSCRDPSSLWPLVKPAVPRKGKERT